MKEEMKKLKTLTVHQRLQFIYKLHCYFVVWSENNRESSKKPKIVKTKKRKLFKMLSSKCAVFHTKKSKFIKKQEASGLLSTLRLKTPLSNILELDILF